LSGTRRLFVPAGDGAPACWKRHADLKPDELRRWADRDLNGDGLHMKRLDRRLALLEKSIVEGVLTDEEEIELRTLTVITEAWAAKLAEREVAIASDIASGRVRTVWGDQP
jgi:hypothetical protein